MASDTFQLHARKAKSPQWEQRTSSVMSWVIFIPGKAESAASTSLSLPPLLCYLPKRTGAMEMPGSTALTALSPHPTTAPFGMAPACKKPSPISLQLVLAEPRNHFISKQSNRLHHPSSTALNTQRSWTIAACSWDVRDEFPSQGSRSGRERPKAPAAFSTLGAEQVLAEGEDSLGLQGLLPSS